MTASYTDAFGQSEAITSDSTSAVANLNDAPTGVATAFLAAGTEDTPYTIDVADLVAGFTDVDGDDLGVASLVSNGGTWTNNNDDTWTFTPNANFNGPVSLTYDVVDGEGGSVAATRALALRR